MRSPLLEQAGEVDRVVLLGDVLELRQGPVREALAAARPFFEDLGRALAGRELVLVAGNHDHALLEPWLSRRGEFDTPAPLELEQLISPSQASPVVERIAEWASPARLQAAYPGLWVRADVYATHGHYGDRHTTLPILERLGAGVTARVMGGPAREPAGPDDYEASLYRQYDIKPVEAEAATPADILAAVAEADALFAISVETGKTVWKYEQRAGYMSLVATGGGLIFGGDTNGRFRAFDQNTGAVLWEINLGSPVTGYPITYAVNDKQYVAVSTGNSLVSTGLNRLAPELRPSNASNIFVFALP